MAVKKKKKKENKGGKAESSKKGEDTRVMDFLEKLNTCDTYRKGYEPVWKECYQNYKSFLEKKADEDKGETANVFIPESFNAVVSEMARVLPAVLLADPIVRVVPRNWSEEAIPIEQAADVERLIEYQWRNPMRVTEELISFVQSQSIFGTAIGSVFQKKGEKFPSFRTVDLLDFWVPPEARNIKGSPYIIYRTYTTRAELEADGVKEEIPEASDETSIAERLSSVDTEVGESKETGGEQRVTLHHVVWDDRLLTIANKAVVIKDCGNPYKHKRKWFIRVTKFPDLDHFYGIGALEPIRAMQEMENVVFNQRLDALAMVLNASFIADRNAAADVSKFSFRNGGVLYTDPGSRFDPIPKPVIPQGAFMDTNALHSFMQLTTGASDTMQGQAPQGFNDTAFGINALLQEGARKFSFALFMLAAGLKELAFFTHELNRQFLDEKVIVPLIGAKSSLAYTEIQKRDIQFDADFIPTVTSLEDNRPLQLSQLMQFLQTLMQTGIKFDKHVIIEHIGKVLGIPMVDKILGDPQKEFMEQFMNSMQGAIQGSEARMAEGEREMPPSEEEAAMAQEEERMVTEEEAAGAQPPRGSGQAAQPKMVEGQRG